MILLWERCVVSKELIFSGWWTFLLCMHSGLHLMNGFTKPFTTQEQWCCLHSWLYSAAKFIKSFNFYALGCNFNMNLDIAKIMIAINQLLTYITNKVTGTHSIATTFYIYGYLMHWVHTCSINCNLRISSVTSSQWCGLQYMSTCEVAMR